MARRYQTAVLSADEWADDLDIDEVDATPADNRKKAMGAVAELLEHVKRHFDESVNSSSRSNY